MKSEELAQHCADAIAMDQSIILVIPGGPPRGERVRIDRKTRRKCPMGKVLNWTGGGTLALFDPTDVLAWMVANGAVTVEPL